MRLSFAAILLAATAATPALAAPLHQYGGVVIAPKGDMIAALENGGGAAGHAAITVRNAKTGKIVRTIDPCAACGYAGLTFGPDGNLAWVARDRAAGTVTLVVDEGGKTPHTVATIKGIAQTPRFSPDGKHIALLVTIGAAKESGATQAGVRQIGEIGEHSDEQRLAVFDTHGAGVAADAVKPVSPADRYIYEYDWTPDSRGFVATTALGNGDNNWWVATLDAIDAQTGAVRNIAKPATQLNFPRVSPDGQTVAYIGGLMSDFGSVGGDVWTVPITGGTPVDITAKHPGTFTSLAWVSGGLRASFLQGADMGGAAINPRGGVTSLIVIADASLGAGDGRIAWAADGHTFATVVQRYDKAPAIHVGTGAAIHQLTHDNDDAKPVVTAKSITWKNDGFSVQGWLLGPVDADASVKHAMITVVHGGPSAANVPGFIEDRGGPAALVKSGYFVFLPNPRGSYGQGEAFTAANKRDFGGGDLRDILTGIDAAEKAAPIDDARLGLTGGSYGGFMAMWANTQTNRFKAIVAGAGLSNWISYYGTNGIDQWMLPFFGKTMYEDYKAYEAPSAIYHMKNARTPTFIYVGERDIEVPPTQSVEYWHALKDMGVETSLVIYPDEGHGIRGPANTADVQKRTIAWFDKYLGGGK